MSTVHTPAHKHHQASAVIAPRFSRAEINIAARKMQVYGSAFAENIGRAIEHAPDPCTQRRLVEAFPDLVERYAALT